MTWLERISDIHAGSDRLAVADASGVVTGRELIGKAVAAAECLTALDVAVGYAVPALLTTNADALALLIGGVAANMPLAPLRPRLTVGELAAMVGGSASDVVLTETPFIETAQRVAAVTNARALAAPDLPVSRSGLPATAQGGAFYLRTAGTTGTPKQVAFTQDVLSARTEVPSALVGFGPDHRFATGSPLHHLGGLGNTLVAVSMGCSPLRGTCRCTVPTVGCTPGI
jgi:acyl-CoA synthetase (AMP-forming)/AMP-acid ligase II